jgi:hypothetical protein
VTQPQTAEPGASTGTKVLGGAALGLALISLEQQARDDISNTIANLYKGLGAAALLASTSAPGTALTGLALISLPTFHTATTSLFNAARLKVADTVRSSYQAAAQVTHAKLTDDLAEQGYQVPDDLPELGTSLDTLLRDVDTMFGHAQSDLQNLVQTQYNPDDPHQLLGQILDADGALTNRALGSATTAVHRGSTDTQQAIYSDFQNHTGMTLLKRWKTTSLNPCGMCKALNGTTAGINADFNPRATTNAKDLRPTWRNLSGPPRHPNCRCQLELVVA